MSAKIFVPVFLALCLTAGARDLQQAQAPAAGASKPVADLLFVLSAQKATFTDANTLTLTGVTSTAQFYGSGARAGIIPTTVFVNGTAGGSYVSSNGEWLNNPTATLFGFGDNNAQTSLIMTLASPQVSSDGQTVTFGVSVVSNGNASIKTTKGVANEVVEEAATQANYLQTAVQPGATLSNIALFVDSNREAIKPIAQTKTFWWWGPHWGWGGGWGCGWGCGGGPGWGWGK
jgi:hypothetical protein